jgi:hypothetical protein
VVFRKYEKLDIIIRRVSSLITIKVTQETRMHLLIHHLGEVEGSEESNESEGHREGRRRQETQKGG